MDTFSSSTGQKNLTNLMTVKINDEWTEFLNHKFNFETYVGK